MIITKLSRYACYVKAKFVDCEFNGKNLFIQPASIRIYKYMVLSILSRHFLDERAITVFPGAVLNPITQQAGFMSVTGSGHLKRPRPSPGRLTGTV